MSSVCLFTEQRGRPDRLFESIQSIFYQCSRLGVLEPTHRSLHTPSCVEMPGLKASNPRAKSAMVNFLSFCLYEKRPRITSFRAYIPG